MFVKMISVNLHSSVVTVLVSFPPQQTTFSYFFLKKSVYLFTEATVSEHDWYKYLKKENITCDHTTIFCASLSVILTRYAKYWPYHDKRVVYFIPNAAMNFQGYEKIKMTEFSYDVKSTWPKVFIEAERPILHTSLVFGSILLGNGELLFDSALQVFLFFS